MQYRCRNVSFIYTYEFQLILVSNFSENVNSAVMDQDDPCILSLLRGQYLHPPSKNKLSLEAPEVTNPSMGQAQSILEILKNKV